MALRVPDSSHPNPSILSDHRPSSPAEVPCLLEQATALVRSCPPVENDSTQSVLLAALKHLPVDGRVTLMREVVLIGEDWEALPQLGQFFIDAVLKPMLLHRLPINILTGTRCAPPYPEAALESEDLVSLSRSSSGIRQPAVLKELCLRRDGCCCVISGHVDISSLCAVMSDAEMDRLTWGYPL